MKVRWLSKALHNLEVIHEYIARDNPEAALKLVIKIRSAVKQLESFPTGSQVVLRTLPGSADIDFQQLSADFEKVCGLK
jgi:plasmid stabilization system protein ParE